MSEPLEVTCTPAGDAVDVRITNRSQAIVHLLDGPRIPYVLRESADELLVLFGVNPPDPDLDYLGIEIPPTRPLALGEEIERHIVLNRLTFRDHYASDRAPTELHGSFTVRCEVGWGEMPVTDEAARAMSITSLLEWQRLARAQPA
jgi:hypothetical protein